MSRKIYFGVVVFLIAAFSGFVLSVHAEECTVPEVSGDAVVTPVPVDAEPAPVPEDAAPAPGSEYAEPMPGPEDAEPMPGPVDAAPAPGPDAEPMPGPEACVAPSADASPESDEPSHTPDEGTETVGEPLSLPADASPESDEPSHTPDEHTETVGEPLSLPADASPESDEPPRTPDEHTETVGKPLSLPADASPESDEPQRTTDEGTETVGEITAVSETAAACETTAMTETTPVSDPQAEGTAGASLPAPAPCGMAAAGEADPGGEPEAGTWSLTLSNRIFGYAGNLEDIEADAASFVLRIMKNLLSQALDGWSESGSFFTKTVTLAGAHSETVSGIPSDCPVTVTSQAESRLENADGEQAFTSSLIVNGAYSANARLPVQMNPDADLTGSAEYTLMRIANQLAGGKPLHIVNDSEIPLSLSVEFSGPAQCLFSVSGSDLPSQHIQAGTAAVVEIPAGSCAYLTPDGAGAGTEPLRFSLTPMDVEVHAGISSSGSYDEERGTLYSSADGVLTDGQYAMFRVALRKTGDDPGSDQPGGPGDENDDPGPDQPGGPGNENDDPEPDQPGGPDSSEDNRTPEDPAVSPAPAVPTPARTPTESSETAEAPAPPPESEDTAETPPPAPESETAETPASGKTPAPGKDNTASVPKDKGASGGKTTSRRHISEEDAAPEARIAPVDTSDRAAVSLFLILSAASAVVIFAAGMRLLSACLYR